MTVCLGFGMKQPFGYRPLADVAFLRHPWQMRTHAAIICAFLTVGCGATPAHQRGRDEWKYQPERGNYGMAVSYHWADGQRTQLAGDCNGEPNYFLIGGDYPSNAALFTLTVDDRAFTLPISKGEHGGGLFVERYDANQAIGRAKRLISFQVGRWHREARPSAILSQFVRDCT